MQAQACFQHNIDGENCNNPSIAIAPAAFLGIYLGNIDVIDLRPVAYGLHL
jgi:hypothetical protein